jgi:hypothetical protein
MRTMSGAQRWLLPLLLACTAIVRADEPIPETVTPCAAGGTCLEVPLRDLTWTVAVHVMSGLGLAVAVAGVWWAIGEATARRRRGRPAGRPRGPAARRPAVRVLAGPLRVDGTVVRVVEPVPGALRVETLGPRGWTSIDRDPRLFFAGLPGVGRPAG